MGKTKRPTLHPSPFLVYLAFVFCVDCSLLPHAIVPFYFLSFCTFFKSLHSHSHSLPYFTHLTLFFLGIALYIKTCLEPHRIRTTHVRSTGLVSFLSCHYLSSFFLSTCLYRVPFFGLLLVLVAVGGALSCLVLASCCLVLSRSKLIDRPFLSSVSSFVVYPYLS